LIHPESWSLHNQSMIAKHRVEWSAVGFSHLQDAGSMSLGKDYHPD
jgi:hypothetical protein